MSSLLIWVKWVKDYAKKCKLLHYMLGSINKINDKTSCFFAHTSLSLIHISAVYSWGFDGGWGILQEYNVFIILIFRIKSMESSQIFFDNWMKYFRKMTKHPILRIFQLDNIWIRLLYQYCYKHLEVWILLYLKPARQYLKSLKTVSSFKHWQRNVHRIPLNL